MNREMLEVNEPLVIDTIAVLGSLMSNIPNCFSADQAKTIVDKIMELVESIHA